MDIKTYHETDPVPVVRFALSGAFNTDEPLTSLATEAYQAGARNILIDLTDVPYMGSAGLRALHSMYMLLRDSTEAGAASQGLRDGTYHSAHLKLLKPSKMVLEVLKMFGYDMFIEIHSDLKKALDSFS